MENASGKQNTRIYLRAAVVYIAKYTQSDKSAEDLQETSSLDRYEIMRSRAIPRGLDNELAAVVLRYSLHRCVSVKINVFLLFYFFVLILFPLSRVLLFVIMVEYSSKSWSTNLLQSVRNFHLWYCK